MRDTLNFLAGLFYNYDLPKENKFLLHYFPSPLEKQFLRYYYCFGNFDHFSAHTGLGCQRRWLLMLKNRLDKILAVRDKARKEFDLDMLAILESGKYKWKIV